MCKYVLQLLGLELVAGSVCAMSLKDLSFPLGELTWEHFYVVQEDLGLSETETDRVLTQVLGPCLMTMKRLGSLNIASMSVGFHGCVIRSILM